MAVLIKYLGVSSQNLFLQLRFFIFLACFIYSVIGDQFFGLESDLVALGVSLALAAASQIGLMLYQPRQQQLFAVIILDAFILTVFIFATGGANSPLTIFFLLLLILSSILERRVWTWLVYILTILCYSLFIFVPALSDGHDMMHGHNTHLKSMFLVYCIVGAVVAHYFSKFISAFNLQKIKFDNLVLEQQKLSAMTGLMADSAHKIGSPLATIKLAIDELAEGADRNSSQRSDIELIQKQVAQIKLIINELGTASGSTIDNTWQEQMLGDFLSRLRAGSQSVFTVSISEELSMRSFYLPFVSLEMALLAIIKNASLVRSETQKIKLVVAEKNGLLRFATENQGEHFLPQIIAKLGQPFNTSRLSGQGMGLGLYVAKLIAESLGGGLTVENLTTGTRVNFSVKPDA